MAKIAVESEKRDSPRPPDARQLALSPDSDPDWSVSDVICHAGPHDQPYEEQHSRTSIAVVVSGSFQYRTSAGAAFMTPGSLLLGNAGDCFTCGHEHGVGDRCLSFSFSREFLDRLAHDAGGVARFQTPWVPPIRELAPLVAGASAALGNSDEVACEELAVQLAAKAVQVAPSVPPRLRHVDPSSLARVTRVVRMVENDLDTPQDLRSLARIARLSPYHFLRTFEEVTGVTPHQYLLRIRLRRAAVQLRDRSNSQRRILDIALASGFGDVSNFNRMFHAEFGVSPKAYRVANRRLSTPSSSVL